MRTAAITLLAAVTTAGLCLTGTAYAQDAEILDPTALPQDAEDLDPLNSIEITAQRLPNFTPVAITGAVLESNHNSLLLQRADGVVRANIGRSPMVMKNNGVRPLHTQFEIGDPVTVFGRVQKSGDMVQVQADGIYAQHTPTTATLFMLERPKTTMASKMNDALPAKTALRRYNARYTPL